MKKILLICLSFLFLILSSGATIFALNIPRFDNNFAKGLKQGSERVYNPQTSFGIDSNKSLKENIRTMFYPNPNSGTPGGKLFEIIRIMAAGFFVAMIMFTGVQFIWFADDTKKIENLKNSMLYIAYGGFLIFGAAYLVGLMNFDSSQGSADLVTNLQNKILINVIVFMKAITFFLAIVMIFRYGYQIMQAMDAEDKRKKGISGVINVLTSLVFIKLLDFVYYIAQQKDFKSKATSLLVDVSKVIGYVLGGLILLYLIYAGWLMISSNGDDSAYKRATNTLKSIFMVTLVIFLFLMIIYQLAKDFS